MRNTSTQKKKKKKKKKSKTNGIPGPPQGNIIEEVHGCFDLFTVQ